MGLEFLRNIPTHTMLPITAVVASTLVTANGKTPTLPIVAGFLGLINGLALAAINLRESDSAKSRNYLKATVLVGNTLVCSLLNPFNKLASVNDSLAPGMTADQAWKLAIITSFINALIDFLGNGGGGGGGGGFAAAILGMESAGSSYVT